MRRTLGVVSVLALTTACGELAMSCDGGACEGGSLYPTDVVRGFETRVPYVDGRFFHVYRPSGTRYLNDHTVVRGADGRWHVFGITHSSQGMPLAERSLLHAIAPRLDGPWADQPDILMAMGREQVLWAPFVFEAAAGRWVVYFHTGAQDGRLQRADSADLSRWARDPRTAPGGRDPFVLRVGDEWLLYSVRASAARRGQVLVTSSLDLVTWSDLSVALEDPVPSLGWGNLESPFVVSRDGVYYLFVTRTSESAIDYARTVVLASRDPRRFEWDPITELHSHAAEVLENGGQMFITSAGWTSQVGERWRGLAIARLGWANR